MQTYDEHPFKAMLWNKSLLAFVVGGMLASAVVNPHLKLTHFMHPNLTHL